MERKSVPTILFAGLILGCCAPVAKPYIRALLAQIVQYFECYHCYWSEGICWIRWHVLAMHSGPWRSLRRVEMKVWRWRWLVVVWETWTEGCNSESSASLAGPWELAAQLVPTLPSLYITRTWKSVAYLSGGPGDYMITGSREAGVAFWAPSPLITILISVFELQLAWLCYCLLIPPPPPPSCLPPSPH